MLAVSLLCGCGVQRAIASGNTFVEQREYRRALAEYERALRLNEDSDEARRLIAQIKPYALDEAEADVGAELANGHYEQALRHVGYLRRYDDTRAERQRERVEAQLLTHLETHIAQGEMTLAYPLAVRAQRMFPRMQGLGSVFERLRAHFHAEADHRAAAGRFQDALDSLDVIERHEPHQRAALAPHRAQIRGRWADTIVLEAQRAESADELGAAAASYGHAFEIAQRQEDGDAMRRIVRILRKDGQFELDISFAGDPNRKTALTRLATPQLTAIDGVALATDEDSLSMIASVSVGQESCSETHTTSSRSKDYVAGTRQVPNPNYDQLSTEIDNLTTEVNVLSPKVSGKASEVTQLEGRVRHCQRREQDARSNGERRAVPDCGGIESQLSTAKSEHSSLSSRLSSAEARLSSLTSQRASTPRTLSEEIIETFTYDVRHHTRTCSMAVTAVLEPAWAGVENHALVGKTSTSDDSHPGYSQYGIAHDGLSFPLSDASLISAADADAAARVTALVRAKVVVYYASMTDRAMGMVAKDPVAATDMLVAIVAAGRTHLDTERARTIQDHLRARYGLRAIDTLRQ